MIDNFAECNNIACTFTFYIRMSIYIYRQIQTEYSIKNQKYNWKLTFGSTEFAPFDSTEEMISLIKIHYNFLNLGIIYTSCEIVVITSFNKIFQNVHRENKQ